MTAISPLRYPGGKAKMYKEIITLFIKNNISKPIYIEPFAGGCGLALKLLKNKLVRKLILNDIDKSIYSFWYSVLNYNSDFCKMIEVAEITLNSREKQKEIQSHKNKININNKDDILLLGFSTFYLNRVNRSGIIKGGVMGGNQQNGNYKMNCRFNKKGLIDRIEEIGSYHDRITFYNLDAIKFIDKIVTKQKREVFVFFDPPYYKKGSELYTNFYNHQNHLDLSAEITNMKETWIITYDNCDEIKNMYRNFKIDEFNINYSLQEKKKEKEIMIFCNKLVI